MPPTFNDAMNCKAAEKERETLQFESYALMEMSPWELVRLPPDSRIAKIMRIFDLRRGPRCEILTYKRRIVAKGFSQSWRTDFLEAFVPMSKYATLQRLFIVTVMLPRQCRLLDVENAFIKVTLQEKISECQSEVFVVPGKRKNVCVLKMGIHGLCSTSREWGSFLHNFLVQFGFEQSMVGPTHYRREDGGDFVIMVVYVDNIPLFGIGNSAIDKVVEHLNQHIEIRGDEHITKFLGFTIGG